jgi:hypothetical protein
VPDAPRDRLTPLEVDKAFKKRLSDKTPEMQASILKAVQQLRTDPRHPGLRTHSIRGRPGVFGARVDKGNRLTFCWDGSTIVLLNHCNHKKVLGK